jgi:hypothetical protein
MMNKKIAIVILFISIGMSALGQKSINNYKYVVIPLKYNFLSKKDQYRVNTLTRHLFKQEGFVALFDEEQFPDELINDNCKALYVNVDKPKGGLFSTKLEIVLNNCFGKEVYRTEKGSSREKDYKKAYAEALKEAFKFIEQLEYKYHAVANGKENKIEGKVDVVEEEKIVVEKETAVVKEEKPVNLEEEKDTTLYAQEKPYGYQIVDATPKVVMHLLSTSAQNVFLVKDKNAIVYKEDGFWYYSENEGELKQPKTLHIKF